MRDRIFAGLLVVLLALPCLLAPFSLDIRDYRADAKMADLSHLREFVSDHFALRTALLTARGRLLLALHDSGTEQVIAGKNGFLYYADTLPDILGTRGDAFIPGLCVVLSRLQAELRAENRELLVLIAPNKASVYPENLPSHVRPAHCTARLVQEAIKQEGIAYLDALSVLQKNKALPLYFASDTHWNARGAYAVSCALLPLLGENPPPVPEFSPGRAGDLLVLCAPGASPTEADAIPSLPRQYRTLRPMRTLDDMNIETQGAGDADVLLVRDSFGAGLFPFLANACGHLVLSRVYQEIPSQARAAGAKWVVLEIAERNLSTLADKIMANGKE